MTTDDSAQLGARLQFVARVMTGIAVSLMVVGTIWVVSRKTGTWSRSDMLGIDESDWSHLTLLFAVSLVATVPSARVLTAMVHYGSKRRMVDMVVAGVVLAELLIPMLLRG